MLRMELDNFDCLRQTLAGQRETDENSLASATILSERLERLKALDPAFAGVELSVDVSRMMSRQSAVAVN